MEFADENKHDDRMENKDLILHDNSQNQLQSLEILDEVQEDVLVKVNPLNIMNGVYIVPQNVKSIYVYAFRDMKNLTTVICHDEVRYIAPEAFWGCDNLKSIQGIENSNAFVTINGFQNCINLKQISLPSSAQFIGISAFKNCKNLERVDLPSNAVLISNYSFAGCENLKTIGIPSGVELIQSGAFAGCKDLTITFFEDTERKYLDDYEFQTSHFTYEGIPFEGFENCDVTFDMSFLKDILEDEEQERMDIEDIDVEAFYEDFGIKYNKFNINGQEFLFHSVKVTIEPGAISDVKEVVVFNQDTFARVMKSGYKGKITLINKETNQAMTFDLRLIEKMQKEKALKRLEEQNKGLLIPGGGTISWLEACEKYNYQVKGTQETFVSEIPISSDCRIVIEDYDQPISNGYTYSNDRADFCTTLTFYKKELDKYKLDAPYERAHTIYYPFGTRFDEETLKEIGQALSMLIDNARHLLPIGFNKQKLLQIRQKEKQLIELFFNGVKDRYQVHSIMTGIKLKNLPSKIRVAASEKDWLPYFTTPFVDEKQEFKENDNECMK